MDYDWKSLLVLICAKLLDTADKGDVDWFTRFVPNGEAMLTAKWLGYAGTTEAQITTAEARLGKMLPPDYRQFLLLTNGWRNFRHYPWGLISLLSVEKVDWLLPYEDRERTGRFESWAEALEENPDLREDKYGYWNVPEEHFRATLVVGESDGNEIMLLNPLEVSEAGEWAAWIYEDETGIQWFESFWALMKTYADMRIDSIDSDRWWEW